MKTIIHVNQHAIRQNLKDGTDEPVLTVKTYKSNVYAHEVEINGPSRVVYSPDKPLSCGARVWIETQAEVKVIIKHWRGTSNEAGVSLPNAGEVIGRRTDFRPKV